MPDHFVILGYHGVTSDEDTTRFNLDGKHIHMDAFEEQMAWIAEHCHAISMELVGLDARYYGWCEGGGKPHVAVTFDDGYYDTYANVVPILAKYKIPGTFYITMGFLGAFMPFWTDVMEAYIVGLDKGADDLRKLKAGLKEADEWTREKVMASRLHNGKWPEAHHGYGVMNMEDVQLLSKSHLVGAHGWTHTPLTQLMPSEWGMEINLPLMMLQQIVGHPVRHFSYPEGDYDEMIAMAVRRAGVVACPTAMDGVNKMDTDRFQLRRIFPGWQGRAFPYKELGGKG